VKGGGEPKHEQGKLHIPKKEVAINLINPHSELAMLTLAQDENQALWAQFFSVQGRI